jgi:hypothetical protein
VANNSNPTVNTTRPPLARLALAALLAASLALLAIAAGVDSPKSNELNPPLPPVTMRYFRGTNSSKRADQPTFWVTNHTDKALSIKLQTIEIKNGQVWTTYCQAPVPGLLYFRQSLSRNALLAPHAAGFGEMLSQRVTLPTNQVWRVRASVAEKLVGGEDVVAAVKQLPQHLQARLATGKTNILVNPFRKDLSRFGHYSEVTSEEVLVAPLATADSVRALDAPKPARPSIYDESLDGFKQIADALGCLPQGEQAYPIAVRGELVRLVSLVAQTLRDGPSDRRAAQGRLRGGAN